jgi:VanZ family protein
MAMRLLRRADPWLPPLVVMAAIFFFSAQPSLDSHLGTIDLVGRKLIHFSEYALLCWLWWRVFVRFTSSRRAALIALAVSSAYAATDELHQTFVDGRHGTPVDWAIDTAGATLAVVLIRRSARARARARAQA